VSCASLVTGPTSVCGPDGSPARSGPARSTNSDKNPSSTARPTITRLAITRICPEGENEPTTAALAAVAGDDDTGARPLGPAQRAGIDVSPVARRAATGTRLIVDAAGPSGERRYLGDLPPSVLLDGTDAAAAGGLIAAADWGSVQLQQPPAAARPAAEAGAAVVLDGTPSARRHQAEPLALASAARTDAREASLLAGPRTGGMDDARRAPARNRAPSSARPLLRSVICRIR
jgi:hypothetical protein